MNQNYEIVVLADDRDRVHVGGFVPRSLKAAFADAARRNNRSVSGELRAVMYEHVATEKHGKAVAAT